MKPEFMSAEHVAAMNSLLAESAEVRTACQALGTTRTFAYFLSRPPGPDVYWTVTFSTDGMVFSLDPPAAAPDVRIDGQWAAAVRNRATGEPAVPALAITGDPRVLEALSAILDQARAVATIDVRFPEVG